MEGRSRPPLLWGCGFPAALGQLWILCPGRAAWRTPRGAWHWAHSLGSSPLLGLSGIWRLPCEEAALLLPADPLLMEAILLGLSTVLKGKPRRPLWLALALLLWLPPPIYWGIRTVSKHLG